jgi:superoxide dismutase, Cu-Zn family
MEVQMPRSAHPSCVVLTITAVAGLLLGACQQSQPSPTSAPTKPAATASPAAAASPASSPAAVASPSPLASPQPVTVPSPAAVASPAASPSPSPGPTDATAELRNAQGQLVGTALLSDDPTGLRVLVQVTDLPGGVHGIHMHAVGRCDPPDFMSAGAHFNPAEKQHGLQNPAGPHAGDLPNIEIAANSTGQLNVVNNQLTLRSGPNTILDPDGSALVIHANPDDNVTDPAGNSGGRIACGVIRRG